MNRVTLLDFMAGRAQLTEQHLQSFKQLISKGVRAPHKKQALARMTLGSLYHAKPIPIYERIVFYPDGHCEYIAGQDYTGEIRFIREQFLK